MRKLAVIMFIGMISVVAIGGYLAMPADQSKQSFAELKLGMKFDEVDRIMLSHGFRGHGGLCSEGCMSYVYVNGADIKVDTSYRLSGDLYYKYMYMEPRESVVQRACNWIKRWTNAGNPNPVVPTVPSSLPVWPPATLPVAAGVPSFPAMP